MEELFNVAMGKTLAILFLAGVGYCIWWCLDKFADFLNSLKK